MTTPADLVLRNSTIHTMSPAHTTASALAVSRGKIVAVGSDSDMATHIGPATEVVDLHGSTVIPGLVDAHNHHSVAGRAQLFECQFPDSAGVDDILRAVDTWVSEHPDDEWVIGGTWGSGLFQALTRPGVLARLDEASGGKKVLLTDDSHHNKWANSAAMEAGGILATTPDPEGGQILRTADGALTGVLVEAAGALVEAAHRATAAPTTDFWAACSARGIQSMNERGITAFMDASASEGLMSGLHQLDERGELTAWAVSAMLINDFIFGTEITGTELFDLGEQFRSEHHRPDFSKIFLDGVPPSYTASFIEPYADSPQHGDCYHGTTTMPTEELLVWLRTAGQRGLGVKVHCTGDAAVRHVLDAVEILRKEGITSIFHVAHGQYIAEADIPRFGPLGVIAEISPALWFPGIIVDVLRSVLTEPRGSQIHPNRDLLDAGATVACGSDWPVSPDPNPWIAISGLVTRADPYGQHNGTVWPEQAISVREALTAHTLGGAKALGLDDTIGSLEVGKSADFVELDRDPLQIAPAQLAGTITRSTWFAGRKVYAAEHAEVLSPE